MHSPRAGPSADAEKAPRIMLSLTETDNDRTVDVRVGEAVRLTLPENASTGYRWAIDRYDEKVVEAVATEPHYSGKAIGSGGEVAFVFQARKPASGKSC
jgi:inhibitor of cysteine peptidase